MKRRILSILMALVLCVGACPTWALAEESVSNSCTHHTEHTQDCGYKEAEPGCGSTHEHTEDCYRTEDGSPCAFECRICPIEELSAALSEAADITEGNADEIKAQLEEILALYQELTEDEQGQIDLSRCYELQEALDNANAPMPGVTGENVTGNVALEGVDNIILTAEGCGENCAGHTFTQQGNSLNGVTILVKSGVHNVTFQGLNLSDASIGVMPGGTMNLTLNGINTIAGNSAAGIYVPEGAVLVITEESTGSLNISSKKCAGIGGASQAPYSETSNLSCGTVIINGGTITAAGGSASAGIGGTESTAGDITGGNGGNITINGGTVTASGGNVDGYWSGAGIGGGGSRSSRDNSGCGGTLTINGGVVTLTAGSSSSYGFGKGTGGVPSGPCSLTLANESYLTLTNGTALDPNGTYTIYGDPTKDMIVAPDLEYTGEVLDTSGIKIDDSKTGTAEYFGRTFQVKASAEGWVKSFDPATVQGMGEYTVIFTKDDKSIQKTFTVVRCLHRGETHYEQAEGEETHNEICSSCGAVLKTEACTFGNFTYQDETDHRGVCVCGREKLLPHSWKDNSDEEIDAVTRIGICRCSRTCTDCSHREEMGAFVISYGPAEIPYGQTAGKELSVTGDLEKLGVTEIYWTDNKGAPVTERGKIINVFTLPAELECGAYKYHAFVSFAGTYLEFIFVFEVTPLPLTADMVTLSPDSAVYNGTAHTPGVTVTHGDKTLTTGADYTVEYGNNTNAGTATVTVSGQGNYGGTVEKTFTIRQAAPTLAWESTPQELTYTGKEAVIPAPKATGVNGVLLGISQDTGPCQFSYAAQGSGTFTDGLPIDAGTYTIRAHVAAKGNYTAAESTNTLTLTIQKADQDAPDAPSVTEENIRDTSITLTEVENAEYSLDGTSWQGSPTFTGLSPNKSYTFYVRLKGDKNHNASPSNTASITTRKTMLDGAIVTVDGIYIYDGQEKTPEIRVTLHNTVIPSGEYDISYANSGGGAGNLTNAGTVTVTITARGDGDYSGTATGEFRIDPAMLTVSGAAAESRAYDGTNEVKITAVTLDGIMPGDEGNVAVDVNDIRGTLSGVHAGIYSAVTLPELTLSGASCGNYTLVQPSAPVPAAVEITRLDTQITVGTAAYDKTFGDAAFLLDVTDNNPEADVRYEVTAGADVVSVEDGMVTILAAGRATITVSLPESANCNAAESKTITVNVEKRGGYTVEALNRRYLYSVENTDSIDLAALLPGDCGAAAYGIPVVSGNVAYGTAPAVADGKLSYTQAVGNNGDEGSITVTVATRNYEDITITIKVRLTDRVPVSLKEGTQVTAGSTLTYGEPLSRLTPDGAVFVDDEGNTVSGVLAWKDGAARPDAGTISAAWVFTPTDLIYEALEGTAEVTVNRAAPTVSAVPTVAKRIYDPSRALEGGDLSGGAVSGVDGKELAGEWSWQNAGLVPTVTGSGYTAVFTPTDTANYEIVTRTISVTVERATPCIVVPPAAAGITYGDALSASALSGGVVQYGDGLGQVGSGAGSTETVAGTFAWKEPSVKPAVADSDVTEYTIVFTPSDTANYRAVETTLSLTVNRAQNAPNMPGSAMEVPNSREKVGDVPLPEGWKWETSAKETALEAGVAVNAVAVYNGADKGNYMKETVTIAITRSPAAKPPGDGTTESGNSRPGETEPGNSRPGETEPGNGSTEETGPEPGRPFIKGEDGRNGWDVIRAEEERAEEGSTINVDMNGSAVVPGDIFDSIKGRDITITFDMGNDILWSVDGKSIVTEKAGDIDFSVETGVNTVPVEIVNNVTGGRYSLQIRLAYEGEFGFTAVLSIDLGRENAGRIASLYYYNKSAGEMEFIGKDHVAEDGTASLAFTHASDYVIVLEDSGQEEESGSAEPAQPEISGGHSAMETEGKPRTGQPWKSWRIVVIGMLVIVVGGAGVFFIARKKKEN